MQTVIQTALQTVDLAGTGRHTTRLGFGCSAILGGLHRRKSLHLLDAAWDAGIRHFDCAPMYGFGTAEEVLGEFAQRHAGAITITTKFGLLPGRQHSPARLARAVGRRVFRALRIARPAHSFTPELRKAAFTTNEASRSLTQSLRNLRTERVDLFLLHEATANDLHDDALLHTLQQQVQQGRIGAFGVGTTHAHLGDLRAQRPEYCPVIQSEWSASDAPLTPDTSFRITHRGLQGGWQEIYHALLQSPAALAAWSQETDVDLHDKAMWPRLLLHACLAANPFALVLFSTRNPSRIADNVAAAQNSHLVPPALRLHGILQQHRQQLLPTHTWPAGYSCRSQAEPSP